MEKTPVQPHERKCAVCAKDFTTPKILPCGHLLCRECVISWMDSKPEAGCPLCKCDQISFETVDALPTDFVMEALVESARVLSKDHLCCVCEDVRADFICMQCQDMLCLACTKVHRKLSVSRSHDVESLSTVTPERLAASRPALCADHGDKQADLFCFKHRLPICGLCTSIKHNVCLQIRNLDYEMNLAKNALSDLTKNMTEAELKLYEAIGQLTLRLQEADVKEQEDLAEVDKTCGRLHMLVEEFRKKQKELTKGSYFEARNSLHKMKTSLSSQVVRVTAHKHIVRRTEAVTPCPALIHAAEALTHRVKSLATIPDLESCMLMETLSNRKWYEEVVGGIEKELLKFEQQKTESKGTTTSSWLFGAPGQSAQQLSTAVAFGCAEGSALQPPTSQTFGNFPSQGAGSNRIIQFGQPSYVGPFRSFSFDPSATSGLQFNFSVAAPKDSSKVKGQRPSLK